MRNGTRWVRWAVGVLGLLALGCAGEAEQPAAPPDAVRIGAFNFDESELLAEIYAQALEARGVPVERLGRLGSREVVQPALGSPNMRPQRSRSLQK